nr:retrovirus-related Pol polyprotein from transposon TNT 1-94 [Tanacetum cinerariifolium]
MLNGSILSKHFWTEAVRISFYTQNRSIIVKRHDKTSYKIFKERILNISYFHMFGCPVFIHNHKDHLGKFDAKADDGYFLGYSFVSKAFRVINTRRQQVDDTYHVTFDESIEAIRFTNTSVDEIGINDSSRYPPENQVPEVIAPNEPDIPHIEDTEASTSSHRVPQDRWARDQRIELVNIIGDSGEGMFTRIMVAKLLAASASECLFVDFLFEIEPKKVSEALKHSGWVDAMQEELNQFYRNRFEKLMTKKFEMGMMGELTYFLGLQIKQDDKGILICQEQYTMNLLNKYEISNSFSVKTPMVPLNNLGSDLAGKPVNETSYRGMIGILMYLTVTRPDIQFSTVLCSAKKQQSVAMSSSEAEYVVVAGCCAISMKSQLNDYDIHYKMVPITPSNLGGSGILNIRGRYFIDQ